MDEEEYNRICKNIQQENKYIIKEGLLYILLYKRKGEKNLRLSLFDL